MMETKNSSYMLESTTSQLLVYDPYKPFYTLDKIEIFRSMQDLTLFIGANMLTGEFRTDTNIIHIYDSFELELQKENKYLFVKNQDLNIAYHVENFEEIIPSLLDELLFLWNTYAMSEDHQLTDDAIELKQVILSKYNIIRG